MRGSESLKIKEYRQKTDGQTGGKEYKLTEKNTTHKFIIMKNIRLLF